MMNGICAMGKVDVLGTEYTIEVKKYDEDESFDKNSFCGYCDEEMKKIVLCDMTTYPGFDGESEEKARISERQTLRHEMVHAFFNESGLSYSSNAYSRGWAKNEEMVDWIAIQGPKIFKAWQEVGAV